VIDLGPEGGHAGGQVVATGTPENVAASRSSHTGRFLRRHLARDVSVIAAPRRRAPEASC
jgi:excinuclease ABC subunit A